MFDTSPPVALTMDQLNLAVIGQAVSAELKRASMYPPFNSAHEGFAVLLEEVDELKAHVWSKQISRNVTEMRKEAVQVAAMAIKFIQMIDATGGRK